MDSYTQLRLLGEGAYSRVFLARDTRPPWRLVCIKQLFASVPSGVVHNEVRLLQRVRHPNVVRFVAATQRSIVMAFCPGGDLRTFLRQQPPPNIHEDRVWYWILQLCLALCYLHHDSSTGAGARAIWHRDLKTSNVFLTGDGFLVLGDLGIAREASFDLASTVIGTPLYMAPEIWDGLPYDGACDLWALGCTIYEMCMGKTPFEDAKSTPALVKRVCEGKYDPLPATRWSLRLRTLVDNLLRLDPTKRPTAATILKQRENAIHLQRYVQDRVNVAATASNEETHEKEEQAILRTQLQSLGISMETETQPSPAGAEPRIPPAPIAVPVPAYHQREEGQRRLQRERDRHEQLRAALRRMQELRDQQQTDKQLAREIGKQSRVVVAAADLQWRAPIQADTHTSDATARPSSSRTKSRGDAGSIAFSGIPRTGVPLTKHARSFVAKTQSPLCRDVRVLRKQESAKASARYKTTLDEKFNTIDSSQQPRKNRRLRRRSDDGEDTMADCIAQLEAALRAHLEGNC